MIGNKMTEKQAKSVAKKCLPCPFCGKKLEAEITWDGNEWIVSHPDLICIAQVIFVNKGSLKSWNTRDDLTAILPT